MNNSSLKRRLFIAAAGGLAGFFILLSVMAIYFIVFIASSSFPLGGSSPSFGDKIILFGFIPLVISIAAGLPAWALGAKWWLGFFIGVVAMGTFMSIEFIATQINSYGLFNKYETLAFITAALTTALIAAIKVHRLQLKRMAAIFILGGILMGLRFVMPNDSIAAGCVISLLAWILLPLAAAYSNISEQNR